MPTRAQRTPVDSPTQVAPDPRSLLPFALSGNTEADLCQEALRVRAELTLLPGLELCDVACMLATSRPHLDRRAIVLAASWPSLLDALDAVGRGAATPAVVQGRAEPDARLAVLFAGQRSDRAGLGRALAPIFPVFREALDAVCAELAGRLEQPVDLLAATEGWPEGDLFDQTAFTQVAGFAAEVALFRLVESWGVRPDRLLGYSAGEIVAAHVAGALSLVDAAVLVTARARLIHSLPGRGTMVAVEATEEEVQSLLAGPGDPVDIAAVHGPAGTVIAGDESAVLELAAYFEASGRRTKRLRVSHGFHSPHMDAVETPLRRALRELDAGTLRIPVVSNVTGKPATAEELASPDHWSRHVRGAVRFVDGVHALESAGVSTFLDLSPDGILSTLAAPCLTGTARSRATFLPAMRKDRSDVETLATAVAGLHVRGHQIDWEAYFVSLGATPVRWQSSRRA